MELLILLLASVGVFAIVVGAVYLSAFVEEFIATTRNQLINHTQRIQNLEQKDK